jgi:phage/plasmid-associated DNA primase
MLADEKRDPGAADSARWNARGTRLAVADELSKKKKLKSNIIKIESGNDDRMLRDMFKTTKMVETTYKLLLVANNVPGFDDPDEAAEGRMHNIEFNAIWGLKEEVPESEEEQKRLGIYLADEDFADKLKGYGAFGLKYMMMYYPIYKKEGLGNPEHIKVSNDSYRKKTNKFYKFQETCIEKEPNSVITEKMLRKEYREWIKDLYPGTKPEDNDDIMDYFKRVLGPNKKSKWTGYRIIQDDDEEGNGYNNQNINRDNQQRKHGSNTKKYIIEEDSINEDQYNDNFYSFDDNSFDEKALQLEKSFSKKKIVEKEPNYVKKPRKIICDNSEGDGSIQV